MIITWLQDKFQKHLKALFVVLLGVVIIAFVFTIGNTPGIGEAGSEATPRYFYGYDLNSRRDVQALLDAASISLELNTGYAPSSRRSAQIEEAALSRAVFLHLADQLRIPDPSSEKLIALMRSKPIFRDPRQGDFSEDRYTRYLESVKSSSPARADLIPSVLREDFRIEQVVSVLKGPSYFLPFEIEQQLAMENTLWSVQVAEFDFESFNPEVEVDPEALENYYKRYGSRYEEPEKVETAYIVFRTANFIPAVGQPTEEELQAYFAKNKAKYAIPEPPTPSGPESLMPEGKKVGAEPVITLDHVRGDVIDAVVQEKAKRLALRAADDFVYELFDRGIQKDSQMLTQALEQQGLELNPLKPYNREHISGDDALELPRRFLEQAFNLDAQRYYSDPQPIEKGAAVLFLNGTIPPRMPAFEDIKEEVTADYLKSERERLFSERGQALYTEFTDAIAEGRLFADVVEVEPFNVKSYQDFTLRDTPEGLNRRLLPSLRTLRAGEVSPMITIGKKGNFVYVEKREVSSVEPDSEAVQRALDQQQMFSSMMSERSLVAELIRRGLEESEDLRANESL